jgi:antitoxin CptB
LRRKGGSGKPAPLMTPDTETVEARRKRLLWRATHRGIKEMDLLLGGFVTARLGTLSDAEVRDLEAIIDIPDQQMLAWATEQEALPDNVPPLLLDILRLRP